MFAHCCMHCGSLCQQVSTRLTYMSGKQQTCNCGPVCWPFLLQDSTAACCSMLIVVAIDTAQPLPLLLQQFCWVWQLAQHTLMTWPACSGAVCIKIAAPRQSDVRLVSGVFWFLTGSRPMQQLQQLAGWRILLACSLVQCPPDLMVTPLFDAPVLSLACAKQPTSAHVYVQDALWFACK